MLGLIGAEESRHRALRSDARSFLVREIAVTFGAPGSGVTAFVWVVFLGATRLAAQGGLLAPAVANGRRLRYRRGSGQNRGGITIRQRWQRRSEAARANPTPTKKRRSRRAECFAGKRRTNIPPPNTRGFVRS